MLNAAARQTITGSIVKVYIHTCILDTCTYTCDIALAKPSGHRQYHRRYACIHTYVYTCTYMCEIPLQRQIIIGGIVKVYTRTHIMYTCTYTCAVPLAKQSGHRRHRQSNPTLQNTAQSTRKLPAAHNHPRTRAHTHAHHNVCQEIFDTILNQAKKRKSVTQFCHPLTRFCITDNIWYHDTNSCQEIFVPQTRLYCVLYKTQSGT